MSRRLAYLAPAYEVRGEQADTRYKKSRPGNEECAEATYWYVHPAVTPYCLI